jgi:16S rRNA (guanine(527)-N(7))-methyltransferase RsmG
VSTTGHGPALQPLGLAEDAASALEGYLDVLAAWSARLNLTAAKTALDRVRLLVAPVVPLAPLALGPRLIDVGSGNGSPGLVLAILRRDLHVTLLEPRTKRWAFLREAARAAGLARVEVLRVRHDGYEGPPATTVTLRALRLPIDELTPLVERGGRLLVLGSPHSPVGPWIAEDAPPAPGLQVFRRST